MGDILDLAVLKGKLPAVGSLSSVDAIRINSLIETELARLRGLLHISCRTLRRITSFEFLNLFIQICFVLILKAR